MTAFTLPSPAPTTVLRPVLHDAHLRYGQPAVMRGHLPAAEAGRPIDLQFAPRGGRWRTVASSVVRPDGAYRVTARLRSSGALRIVEGAVPEAGRAVAGAAAEAAPASAAQRVAVEARLVVGGGGHDALAGSAVNVRGTLLPRGRGRRVVIEAASGGRWHAVARTHTRANGHFVARVVDGQLGTTRLRARFAGDRGNDQARADAGSLRGFRETLASWYAMYGGALACGGTLGYDTLGVANKALPCGTKVTLRYRGREVTVPVVDRGPYVGGREWDLTGATARALGFDGVGVVWSTR